MNLNIGKKTFLIIAAALLLLSVLPTGTGFLTDLLWFRETGYESVFLKLVFSKFIIGAAVAAIVAVISYFTIVKASRFRPSTDRDTVTDIFDSEGREKNIRPFIKLFSVVFGIAAGVVSGTYLWNNILMFIGRQQSGVTDPLFNRDISFYFFNLELFEKIYSLAIIFIFCLAVIIGFFTFYVQGMTNNPLRTIFERFSYLGAAAFVVMAFGFQLKAANLVYSENGAAFGAGWADLKIMLPFYYAATLLSVVSAVTLVIGFKNRKWKTAVSGPLLLTVAVIAVNIIYPAVNGLVVKPDELNKEREYITRNITMTNIAYGTDEITEQEFPAENTLTAEDLADAEETVKNIRINDFRPARVIYNQLQSMRLYYTFPDVDVDRYELGGEKTQVFLSGREIDQDALISQSWINKYLKYTHGYGIVASPVNEITPEGQPALIVRNIPPESDFPELEIKRPEIYFGQLTNNYVIVNTDEKEFDYPLGNDNAETLYEGSAGIKLSGINRLLFSIRENSLKMLISGAIHGDSKILVHRNIRERLERTAPFLTFDSDPYLVVSEGKLYWIADAYTVSQKFPYSQPIYLGNEKINYIRNSVKATVDAYDGSIHFYLVDQEDPIASTYANIFPDLFSDVDEAPEGLRKHFRYPFDLFNIQTVIYQNYHMSNPSVFYNKEDSWAVAKEHYQGNTADVSPYYVTMQLSPEKPAEFILIRPFTPVKKDNLVSWLTAGNDGENYGKLVLFRLPKQKLVYGPMQIESRIDQDSEISKELTLWGQQGSTVLRGNLLIIPVKNSFLYVEPLYIQADNENSLPEVKRIIVSYDDRIVMEKTLEEALEKIFGSAEDIVYTPEPDGTADSADRNELIAEAADIYRNLANLAGENRWQEYGENLEKLGKVLERLEQTE